MGRGGRLVVATTSETVHAFQGLAYGRDPVPAFSARRPLDTPRELVNLVHDEHGQLWMPPALDTPDLFHTFAAGDRVKHMANVAVTTVGLALIVQIDNAVFIFDTANPDPSSTVETLIADVGSGDTIWVNATDPAVYIGVQQKTWKVTGAAGARVVTEITGSTQQGFHSLAYKGRRFVLQRQTTVKFSDLNAPETFDPDSEFQVGGDQTGGSWQTSPGSVVALVEIEDVLLVCCTNSIWALTGTHPENFRLRRTNSDVGVWSRDSIVRTQDGLLFVGGTPRGEMGVYLFTGNQSVPVSDEIAGLFRDWSTDTDAAGHFEDASRRFSAVRWKDRYILAATEVNDDRQVYVYHLKSRVWSTMDGYPDGTCVNVARFGGALDRLLLAHGNSIYVTHYQMARSETNPSGRVTLGWHDQGRPAGMVRFLGAKVGVWVEPGAVVDLDMDAAVPNGSTSKNSAIPVDFHHHTVVPVKLRGKALEVALEITGGDEALLESFELVMSRKGEKMSRE